MTDREQLELVKRARKLTDEQIRSELADHDDVATDTHRSLAHRTLAQTHIALLESVLEERRVEDREEHAADDFDNQQVEYWK